MDTGGTKKVVFNSIMIVRGGELEFRGTLFEAVNTFEKFCATTL